MSVHEPLPLEPDLPADPPDAYVEALVRRAGTSFFWAMRRLDTPRRRGVFAVYAFCRDVDDIADGDLPLDRKRELLDAWRHEIELLYGGTCHHPISRALLDPVRTFNLQKADFLAVIDGMEMDAAPRVRLADMDELALYCDRVACAVGRLCVRIFGLGEDEGVRLSAELGMALQLTNILRDIVEDAGRDRVYLPADLLAGAGADGEGIEDVITAPGLAGLCDDLADRAEKHFEAAKTVIAAADPDAVRPAVMMMQVYCRILDKLQKRGWQNLETDVGPSKFEKIMIAVRYGVFG
ncbi:presqualene diphosphate synthase HpnD [Thalassospiraceae bacterium LMO-JJ14]|nr:presqualene diphosphate synthase HpnD [Thalassospiraceae bacterium LMO-JJ14]